MALCVTTPLYVVTTPFIIDMPHKTREARNAYKREYYRTHPEFREKRRKYIREWRKRNPEKRREYALKRKEKLNEAQKRYQLNNPDKVKAISRARYVPLAQNCVTCNSEENLEHHHPDYSRPHHTITLCRACHKQLHWKIWREQNPPP